MNLEVYRTAEVVPDDVDSIVIPGKQIGIGSKIENLPEDSLSIASRFNAIAGAMLWLPDRKIILSGN